MTWMAILIVIVIVLLRAALMTVSSVFVKTPVHNGLSTMPIEFRVVQEHRRQQQQEQQQEVKEQVSLALFCASRIPSGGQHLT